jgi:hypothetical protein
VAGALANGQFVNFGTGGEGGRSAAASGSDDVMRVVQTLMAAQVITGGNGIGSGSANNGGARQAPRELDDLPPDTALVRPTVPSMPAQTPRPSPYRKS